MCLQLLKRKQNVQNKDKKLKGMFDKKEEARALLEESFAASRRNV